jgi:hypothetical protein
LAENDVPKVEDVSSDTESGSDNSTHGYFDPPIQNYRSMQQFNNRKTGNFEGNMFVI